MTIQDFKRELDAAYSTEIPKPQLELIGRMVAQAMHEAAYRHFLEFTLERCDRKPTAATVKGLLRDYIDYTPSDEHDVQECRDCNGTRFVPCLAGYRINERGDKEPTGKWYRCTKEEYMATAADWRGSAMCHCHAGYGNERAA